MQNWRSARFSPLHTKRWRTWAVFCALGLLIAGCTPHDNQQTPLSPRGKRANDLNVTAIWPFWPTSMSIHPLTRLTTEAQTGRTILEARVEFLDSQGNRSKAVGQMTLALYNLNDRAMPIHVWSQDLLDPGRNQQHFDIVTRTYLMRLELDPDKFPDQPELRVSFNSVDGQTMDAEYRIKRSGVTHPQ